MAFLKDSIFAALFATTGNSAILQFTDFFAAFYLADRYLCFQGLVFYLKFYVSVALKFSFFLSKNFMLFNFIIQKSLCFRLFYLVFPVFIFFCPKFYVLAFFSPNYESLFRNVSMSVGIFRASHRYQNAPPPISMR
jgi:hypothetical protein